MKTFSFLFLFFTTLCQSQQLPKDWSIDYSSVWQQTLTSANGVLKFTLLPNGNQPLGARISTNDHSKKAKFCAEIKIDKVVSGTVFALYASSDEPFDRNNEKWDEFDIEFAGSHPNQVWINLFHAGSQKINGKARGEWINNGRYDVQTFNNYCIQWDLNQQTAEWIKNGKVIRNVKLDNFRKPLKMYIVAWGGNEAFAGVTQLNAPISMHVKNIQWHNYEPAPAANRYTYP